MSEQEIILKNLNFIRKATWKFLRFHHIDPINNFDDYFQEACVAYLKWWRGLHSENCAEDYHNFCASTIRFHLEHVFMKTSSYIHIPVNQLTKVKVPQQVHLEADIVPDSHNEQLDDTRADVERWIRHLAANEQKFVAMLLRGEKTSTICRVMGLKQSGFYTMRNHLRKSARKYFEVG